MMSFPIPVQLEAGQRIAQLLLLPHIASKAIPEKRKGGFGSTDTSGFWQTHLGQRPQLTVMINGQPFQGLLDTGADVSIISKSTWPQHWPLVSVSAQFTGIGTLAEIQQSKDTLICIGPEGQTGQLQPYVAAININLWGRDSLTQWGASLQIPTVSKPVKAMLTQSTQPGLSFPNLE